MDDTIRFVAPALAWAAVVYRFRATWRQAASEATRALWLSMLLFAAATTVLIPAIYLDIDRATRIPNVARLIAHVLVILASWSSLAFLAHFTLSTDRARTRVRRALWLALVVSVVLIVLFVAANPANEEARSFTDLYAGSRFIDAYRLVFLAYVGVTLATVVRLSWSFRRVSGSRPALHLGLTLVAAGGTVGLAYVANGVLYVFAQRFGVGYPLSEVTASTVLGAVSVSLVVIGTTMPAWGRRLGIEQAARWLATRRACRRLYPLWRDVCRAAPEIVLQQVPAPILDAMAVRNLRFRLYRRVVEIRDARLVLAARVPGAAPGRAERLARDTGLTGPRLQAVVEAACLRAGIASITTVQADSLTTPRLPRTITAIDLADEVAFLEMVSEAYQNSPVVKVVVAELAAKSPQGLAS
jgi:hypothetical protein